MTKTMRPDKATWIELSAKHTITEICEITGAYKGSVARWASHYNVWPVYECAICHKRADRAEFLTYKRCKDCKGKKGIFPMSRRPVVKRDVKDADYGCEYPPIPATPGRLTYWQQMGYWILNSSPQDGGKSQDGVDLPRERAGAGEIQT